MNFLVNETLIWKKLDRGLSILLKTQALFIIASTD